MLFHRHDEVRIQNDRISSRRSFLQSLPFAAMAFNSLLWREAISLYAADSKRQDRACILLWMQGGRVNLRHLVRWRTIEITVAQHRSRQPYPGFTSQNIFPSAPALPIVLQ